MKVIKKQTEFGLVVNLKKGKKTLVICFGGNGDLYWAIKREGEYFEDYSKDSFTITKENYGVYRLFDELFSNIENINLCEDESVPPYIETEDEMREYLEERRKRTERDKIRYRKNNMSNYNELFDEKNQTITWYSDETAREVANYVKIKKEKDSYVVEFSTQPYIRGYMEDSHSEWDIPIRFNNSGSKYAPFNIIFMKMYNEMNDVDDVMDEGHQIHIEEYLYNQNRPKELIKKK